MNSLTKKQIYDRARYRRLRAEHLAALPPDEIDLISDTDLAYMAGIIDADGSIYCAVVGPHRDKTVYPMVVVAMTDKAVIDWLAERWGAGNVQLHNQTNLRASGNRLKRQYRVTLFGKRAQLLCRRLLPFMRVKKRQAELVCEFPVDARIAPGLAIRGTGLNEVRYRLRDEINALNHMPRNPAARRAG